MNKPNLSPKLFRWLILHARFSFIFLEENPQTPPHISGGSIKFKDTCTTIILG